MHSLEQRNGQLQYTGSLPQPASHSSHNASSSWSENTMHQYINANSGVQQSQSANISFLNGVSANGQMPNQQCTEGLHLETNLWNNNLKGCNRMLSGNPTNTSNSFPSPTSGPQIQTLQYSNSNYANQSLASYSSPTTTFHHWNQTAAVNEASTSRIQDASHLQQNQSSHSYHQPSNGYVTPYATSAPSLPYQQMVKPGSLTSAASENVQTYQVAHYNSALQSSSITLVQNFPNTSENSQQARTQPNSSFYNLEGPTNSRNTNVNNQYTQNPSPKKSIKHPIDYKAQQQLPPSYESHCFSNTSRQSNQTMQPVTSAGSRSCNLSATQPLSLHSVQTLPQGAMPRGPLTVNPLQQNALPVGFTMNTAAGVKEREKPVDVSLPGNNMVSKRCPAGFQNEGPSEKSSVRINKVDAFLKQHPYLINILGYSPTVRPAEDSARPMPAHSVTRAVAVVPPLSQEDGHASSYTPTCNPKNITDIIPEVEKEVAFVEESNVDQEDPNPVTVNNTAASDGAVVTISVSESPSSSQGSEQDGLGPPTLKCSDILPSQTRPEEQNEVPTPPSPPVLELSSIPTVTWTMDSLDNLLLETEKAQVKPREDPKHSVIDQILNTFWNSDIETCHKCYKELMESKHITYVAFVCKRIPKHCVILSQIHPAYKENLKQYHVLKNDEVYSEQLYKSLWLNVNDQLDDIDKEFGFPWTLMQHHYVHETCSQINTTDKNSELLAPEVQNNVSSQLASESVDLTDDDEEASPVASPSSEDTSDSKYSFKLDVLPPEEARAIYEKVQNLVNQNLDFEDVMKVRGSLQPKISNDLDGAAESNMKNKPEQIQVICCFAKFIEMHSPVASSSLRCTCKEKQSCNESVVKPDLENSSENTDNEPITLSSPEHCFKIDKIIDLTNVDEDLYSNSDQASEMTDNSWLNIVSSSDVENTDFIPEEPESVSENVNLAIAITQSEDETLKGEVKSTEATQSASSASSSTQNEPMELHSSETEDILQMSEHEENCEQAEEAESCLENEGQTQITNPTLSSLHVREKTNEERQKQQSSLDPFSPDLSTPKKPVSIATQSEHKELPISETEDDLQMLDHVENCEQASEEAESCLENEGQTQITSPTSSSLHVRKKTNEERQSSLDPFLPDLSTQRKANFQLPPQSVLPHLNTRNFPCQTKKRTVYKTAEEAESCLENERQTQITNPASFSLREKVREKTNEVGQKRQSRLDKFFPGLSTPKKPKLPTSPLLLDVPEPQPEASEIKTMRLALFGSKTRRNSVFSRNKTLISSSTKLEPPEILSFKLDTSTKKPTQSGFTGNYTVKQYLYQKWLNSMPTLNGSVKNGCKNKLKRQNVSGYTKDSKVDSISDRKHKCSLSLKKRRKRGRYGVRVCQPANQDLDKKQYRDVPITSLKENIVLKLNGLPNTFDFKNGSNGVMEIPGLESGYVLAPHPVPVPEDLCAQFHRASKGDIITARVVENWSKLTIMPETCVAPIRIWKLLPYPENSSHLNDHTYHLSQ
nr:uncharacterized protein LOC107389052 isoform X1 [Nothobranchius furzeri]XP_054589241.1 uncharacterized protein LOC107389052 isoform X1 [Nothobranchius furzeri]